MRIRTCVVLLAVTLTGATPPPESRARAVELLGIHAKLYYPESASFSRDILAEPRFSLWNAIIGEGDAEAPSNATLVTVELRGDPGSYGDRATVRLRAVARGRVLVNRATELGRFGTNGRQAVGFWIYDTGCDAIDLTATLSTRPDTLRARIPFECGE